jgi:hypothetical protein
MRSPRFRLFEHVGKLFGDRAHAKPESVEALLGVALTSFRLIALFTRQFEDPSEQGTVIRE